MAGPQGSFIRKKSQKRQVHEAGIDQLWDNPGPPHPGPAEEGPAASSQPGRLGPELAGCLVAGGKVRILQQLLLGSFNSGMSGELYPLCNAGRSGSLPLQGSFLEIETSSTSPDVGPAVGPVTRCKVVMGRSWGLGCVWEVLQAAWHPVGFWWRQTDPYKVSLGWSLASVLKGDPGPLPRPPRYHFLLLECVSS